MEPQSTAEYLDFEENQISHQSLCFLENFVDPDSIEDGYPVYHIGDVFDEVNGHSPGEDIRSEFDTIKETLRDVKLKYFKIIKS